MKREDQTYEKWLDKLKNTEPVLNAPEELTNDILNKIKTLPSGTSLLKEAKGKSKTNRTTKNAPTINSLDRMTENIPLKSDISNEIFTSFFI